MDQVNNTVMKKRQTGGKNAMNKGVRSQFKSPFRAVKKCESSAASLQAEVQQLQKRCETVDREIEELQQQGDFKEEELDEHIRKLHEYNDIKDVGQMLLGRIATKEGVTTKDLYSRFNLDLDD